MSAIAIQRSRAEIACALALVCSCAGAPPNRSPDAAIEARARALGEAARNAEAQTTQMVAEFAQPFGASLVGLEQRLKRHSSLTRKIRARMTENRQTAVEVDIVDALRYTVVIDDTPPARYVEVANAILASIESRGVEVVRVKNYWPRGDNYSGVNVVLRNRDGFQWEIQFHTSASVAVRDQWHRSYEVLRDASVETQRRQAIFDEMTPPWNRVAVPVGALVAGSIHRTERIIRFPRP